MELGSKVTALEEEVAVLKGEIKTILQEVRTAVLARENPFAADAYEPTPVATHRPDPEPAAEPEAPPKVIQLKALPEAEPQSETPFAAPPQPALETPASGAQRPLGPSVGPSTTARRWSVGSLATLMAWTQDAAARMDANDLDIVLSMARYGGLIEAELEATLTKLAASLFTTEQAKHRAGVSDYLLALRELAAIIEDAEENFGSHASHHKAS